MRNQHRPRLALLTVACLWLATANPATAAQKSKHQEEPKTQRELVREVRHQLLMLPYYTVFDNLAYRVEGDRVILEGQVVRPTLKSDAGAAVKSIEGVGQVINNIEVLPLSPMDDRSRLALYRAIYSEPSLSRYGFAAVASIHIIVKNGNVTLEGAVDNQTDRNLASLRANQVPNVFSVTNNLRVTSDAK